MDYTWVMGQSASSVTLQLAQNQEVWLRHKRVVLPFRWSSAEWRNG